ncbi:type II toxin-antitoxin system RelE/ParE family toxin [Chryseobacterium sp. CFBP8996]|uniref:type II toxin-antitoxin system RelE/ParE family toxin n=1 Tax=Chryseobacterium sp. CFBP8996 TaxID=3096529 RepID=UPI002A6AED4D|nr:type II toxin-antitoxin system RelE/ParE family toxin [Chryseobacterium sp. CFBP8996]MDY0929692.1 type II toxin-antitoxin system RelE/ParE family toxin [Chryseobacterium sp. CFBP8996]
MKYEVIWSEFSEKQIDEIFNYYKEVSKSYQVALNIITKILLAPNKLIYNPKIGQRELLLENRNIEYHYIVESNYKIIYSIDTENQFIKIADVFDTRQNPEKMEREK